jgi:N6-L-threonylcarbamoyladenine synthase
LIDKYAEFGDSTKFKFSKPRIDDLDFSFSGLKTSILYTIRDQIKINPNFVEENKFDLCASIQEIIIQILMDKIEKAVKETGINQVAIAGGVSANSDLRKALKLKNEQGWQTYIPKFEYCTDNAAMIAISGKFLFEEKQFANQMVAAKARLEW